eukprot:TRINITY_DN969_c0_g2_i1.p1 TRINITY_DN969_c0_g2~~TRINITY_DN969_c0_g2_i1.p1  ORF type:complete len:261 (+),score=60.85 TRINITY_DN969_c0_g2_i1:116-898(+)
MTTRILSQVRAAVSSDRRRFKTEDYDLDLTYITQNIIAMSFPARGLESAWRNSLDTVYRMLTEHHGDNYMIWNLQERDYNYEKFNNQILNFPFPDHHAPPLDLLLQVVHSIDNWLKASDKNVAVMHCKGGKGRTGTVIAAFLFYAGIFDTIEEAQKHFAQMRSIIENGVTQPSQKRYLQYFSEVLTGKNNLTEKILRLRNIHITNVPKISNMTLEILDYKNNASQVLQTVQISCNGPGEIDCDMDIEVKDVTRTEKYFFI